MTTVVSSRGSSVSAILLLLGALLLCSYAVVLVRRGSVSEARMLVLVAAGLWVLRILLAPDDLPPGLLGAWPLAVFVAADGWSERTPGERRMIGMVALATLGVLATQYDTGGGLNWGGRFLAPALPMLAVLLASTFERMGSASRDGRRLVGAILGLALLTTAASVVADVDVRTRTDRAIDAVVAGASGDVVVTGSKALPQLAWRTYPDLQFVVVPEDGGSTVHDALVRSGIHLVTVFQLPGSAFTAITGRPAIENRAGEVVEVSVAPA